MGHKDQHKKYVTKLIHSFIIKCCENVNTTAELSFKINFSGVMSCHYHTMCMYFTIYAKSPACPRAICLLVSLQSPDEDDPWVCSWPTLSVFGVTRAGSCHRSALLWRSIVTPAQPAATLALNWQVLLAEITQYSERKLLLKLTTLWYWSFLISRNSSPDHFSKNFTICSERDIVTNSF